MRLPLEDAEARWGAPYLVIHRADLQRALADAATRCPASTLKLGTEVAGVADDGTRMSVALKRGLVALSEAADLLIGADGLRSRVRERLGFGEADSPKFPAAWRSAPQSGATEVDTRWARDDVTLRSDRKRISSTIPCAADRS